MSFWKPKISDSGYCTFIFRHDNLSFLQLLCPCCLCKSVGESFDYAWQVREDALPPRKGGWFVHTYGAPAECKAQGSVTLTNPCSRSLSRRTGHRAAIWLANTPHCAARRLHLTGQLGSAIVTVCTARARSRRARGEAVEDSGRGRGIAVERFCSNELLSVGKVTTGVTSRKCKIKTVSLQPQWNLSSQPGLSAYATASGSVLLFQRAKDLIMSV